MTEKAMRKALIKALAPTLLLVPVETGTIPGFPDIYYAGNGTSGLIELKVIKGVKILSVPYRPGQRAFLNLHAKHNPRTFVLGYWLKDYFLLDSSDGFPHQYPSPQALWEASLWTGKEFDNTLMGALDRWG